MQMRELLERCLEIVEGEYDQGELDYDCEEFEPKAYEVFTSLQHYVSILSRNPDILWTYWDHYHGGPDVGEVDDIIERLTGSRVYVGYAPTGHPGVLCLAFSRHEFREGELQNLGDNYLDEEVRNER